MDAKKPASAVSNVLLFGAGILVSLFLLEGVLLAWSYAVRYRFAHAVPAGNNDFVILTLGESTTAGDGPDIWPAQLERMLRQKHPGTSVRVVHKAVPGTNTAVIVGNLERQIRDYRPDVIVSMMGINDEYHVTFKDSVFVPNTGKERFLTVKLMKILYRYATVSARHYYDLHVNGNPSDLSEKGNNFRVTGSYDLSERYILRSIRLKPGNPNAYVLLALLYRDTFRNREAEAALLRAQLIAPESDGVYVELGNFYRDNGSPDRAEAMYRKALALNPMSWLANGEYATFLFWNKDDLANAAPLYERSIAINPDFTAVYFELADIYRRQGVPDRALELYRTILTRDPDNGMAKRELELTRAAKGGGDVAGLSTDAPPDFSGWQMGPMTRRNYGQLFGIAGKYRIPVIAVSYPLQPAQPLRDFITGAVGTEGLPVTVVENESNFHELLLKHRYDEVFTDRFAGNFGHATALGNGLIASNVATAVEGYIPSR